jgi:hypothetical protein
MTISTDITARQGKRATSFVPSPFLRGLLIADAATSAGAGLIMVAGADILVAPLGIPTALLHYAGLVLFPFAAFVAFLGTRPRLARGAVWAVVAVNAIWVADSILLLLSGWIDPTALGYVFVIVQAAAVAVFAELQIVALKRAKAAV